MLQIFIINIYSMKIKNNPKNIKYGRVHVINLKENNYNCSNKIPTYSFGLKTLEDGRLKLNHLNMILRQFKRFFKKEAKLKFNISLRIPVTKKPLEARLGGGKADRSYWECAIIKGMIIFEVYIDDNFYNFYKLRMCMRCISNRLPFFTKVIKNYY